MKTLAAVVVFLLVVYCFGARTINRTPPPKPTTGNTTKNDGKSSNTDQTPNTDGSPNVNGTPPSSLPTTSTQSTMATTLIPLPAENIGFRDIREGGYFFLDKTNYIKKLIDDLGKERLFYISRPKRFGKSVFLGMLHAFFNGSKSLFNDTNIFIRGNKVEEDEEWVRYPVIYLDFDKIPVYGTAEQFKLLLKIELQDIAKLHGVTNRNNENVGLLINDLTEKYNNLPVSILIDNYDAPIISTEKREVSVKESIADFLTSFYDQIRAFNEAGKLRLVFVMGFSKLNILGNGGSRYRDLTFDNEFSSMIGFTLEDVKQYLKPYVNNFAQKEGKQNSKILKELNDWYGGYQFTQNERTKDLLNPASTCQCLKEQFFQDYMSLSRSIPIIKRKMEEKNMTLDYFLCFHAKHSDITSFKYGTIDTVPLHVFMLCTGFLTIKYCDKKRNIMQLSFPNAEVRKNLLNQLPEEFFTANVMNLESPSRLWSSLEKDNIAEFVRLLNDILFKSCRSHTVDLKLTEFFITHQIISILKAAEVDFREGDTLWGKDGKQKGDLDLLIKTSKTQYVIEIKCNHDAVLGVYQLIGYINEKKMEFHDVIDKTSKSMFLVGMNVNSPTLKNSDNDVGLNEWFSIPYRNYKILVNESVASPHQKKDKFIADLKTRLKHRDSSEKEKNPGENITSWIDEIIWPRDEEAVK